MNTQTIYLIVGKKIRQAQARIVGKVAEVKTEYGILEFGPRKFFLSEADAVAARGKKAGKES